MCEFKTGRQLASFIQATFMERDALERYIEDYAEYYFNMRMIEIVADMRADYEEALSMNQINNDEKNDNCIIHINDSRKSLSCS